MKYILRKCFAVVTVLSLWVLPTVVHAANVPKRIVSTAPHITEILFALGAGNRVVGVTRYCNYPPEAKTKTVIGDTAISMETLVKLSPELIIVDADFSSENLKLLQRRGFKTITVTCRDMTSFQSCVKKIALAAGKKEQAARLLQVMERRMQALAAKAAKAGIHGRKTVFIEVWDSPLMTAGGATFMDEIVFCAGGRNVASDKFNGFGRVGTEFLIKSDPDVILLTTSRPDKVPKNWQYLRAVKNKNLFYVNPDLFARPSFRMPECAEKIYLLLYGKR